MVKRDGSLPLEMKTEQKYFELIVFIFYIINHF
jgi:hypothetical protein